MSGRHDYLHPVPAVDAGRVMKVSRDGEIEWEAESWDAVRCPSSDTSIRVKCDGKHLWFSGNIGRFQHGDNLVGHTVLECLEKFRLVLRNLGYDVTGFGTRDRVGTLAECGTFLTRLDLAGNFETDNYSAVCTAAMSRRIGQRLPREGKYGPTWGYESKRSNWMKAKLYDKGAEMEGRRRPGSGATVARFEVQLGSEFLKQKCLDSVYSWRVEDMANVIYGRFADQVFRGRIDVNRWSDIPPRLRTWAVLWRDGEDIRQHLSTSRYYAVAKKLREEYGIDIAQPCNVLSLTRRVQLVQVMPINALRRAA